MPKHELTFKVKEPKKSSVLFEEVNPDGSPVDYAMQKIGNLYVKKTALGAWTLNTTLKVTLEVK